jgi:hypothetical protein
LEDIPFLCGRFSEHVGGKDAVVYHHHKTFYHVLFVEAILFSPLSGTV